MNVIPDAAAGLGGAYVIAVITQQIIKPLLELAVKPDQPAHDAVIRALVMAMGIGGSVINYLITTTAATTAGLWGTLIPGLIVGVAAIANYHLVSDGGVSLPGLAPVSRAGPPVP